MADWNALERIAQRVLRKRSNNNGYPPSKKFKSSVNTYGEQVGTLLDQGGDGTKSTYSAKGNVQKMSKIKSGKIVIKPEKKALDTTIAKGDIQYNYSGSGSQWYQLLNYIASGTGLNQKIGKQVTMCSIQMRVGVRNGASQSATIPQTYRILLWYDRQGNGSASDPNTILEVGNSVDGCLYSPYQLGNRGRFTILWDHTDTLEPGNNTSNFEQFFCKKALKVTFNNGSAGTIGDISQGALYFTIVSNGYLDTTAYARVRFYDC